MMQSSIPRTLTPTSIWIRENTVRAIIAAFILVIIWLFVPQCQHPTLKYINHTLNPPPVLKSPFENTVVIIPFDNAVDDSTIYREVAVAIQLILDAPEGSRESEIQSLLFFHFDAWVDPLDFAGDNFDQIWLPCRRRFWADWIFLSAFFNDFGVFQQVAVPTMMHVIDEARRVHSSRSVLRQLGDCWGRCCTMNPGVREVMTHRCGHKFNYPDANGYQIAMTNYNRLDEEAEMLGKPYNRTHWENWKGKGLSHGEENLGSDPEWAVSFYRNHKGVKNAVEELPEVQEMLRRAQKHSENFVNAIKAYN